MCQVALLPLNFEGGLLGVADCICLGEVAAFSRGVCLRKVVLHIVCYAQGERTVRLGAFKCKGGSSDAYLATAVSGKE